MSIAQSSSSLSYMFAPPVSGSGVVYDDRRYYF